MSLVFMSDRQLQPEIMDGPHLGPHEHEGALRGLRRINAWSGVAPRIAAPIVQMARLAQLRSVKLLDVACGGGDVAVGVTQQLHKAGLKVELHLLDQSEHALGVARQHAADAGINAATVRSDLLTGSPESGFDVVINSLFLHHLTAQRATLALNEMRRLTGKMLVVSDLRRSAIGWAIAWTGCRALSRSPVVHHDGPVSVAAAWTDQELAELATQAGMADARVIRCWPWRFLLTWQPATRAKGAGHE